MLHRLSQALDVPVGFFFDDLPGNCHGPRPAVEIDDILTRPEGLDLLRDYYRVPATTRRLLQQLVHAMALREADQ